MITASNKIRDEYADLLRRFSWNTTRNIYTGVKVLRLMKAKAIKLELEADWQKKDKKPYMDGFYKAITAIWEKYPLTTDNDFEKHYLSVREAIFGRENLNSTFDDLDRTKDNIYNELIVKNFLYFEQENLLDIWQRHNTYFTGVLDLIHRMPNGTILMKFHQKPFSNERQYHWDEPDEEKWFNNVNQNTYFPTMEYCLIATMFGSHSHSANVLYSDALKNKK